MHMSNAAQDFKVIAKFIFEFDPQFLNLFKLQT